MQVLLLRSAQLSGRYVTEIFVGSIAFMRLIEGKITVATEGKFTFLIKAWFQRVFAIPTTPELILTPVCIFAH